MTVDKQGIAGVPLTDAIRLFGPLPEASTRALGAHLAQALVAAHATGRAMGNLTPSRVLLTASRHVFVEAPVESANGENSPQADCFLAPEQVTVTSETGPASDVFSLGGILVYAATGTGPFGTGEIQCLLHRVVHEEPALDALPATLRPLVAACLDKNPAARPPADAIVDWLVSSGPESPLAPSLRAEISRREWEASQPGAEEQQAKAGSLSRRQLLTIAAGATAVLAGGIASALTQGSGWTVTEHTNTPLVVIPPLTRPWTYSQPDYFDNGQLTAVGRTIVWWDTGTALGIDAVTGSLRWTAIPQVPYEVSWMGVSGTTLLGSYQPEDAPNLPLHLLGYDAASGALSFDQAVPRLSIGQAFDVSLVSVVNGIALINVAASESSATLWAALVSTGEILWSRTGNINAAATDGSRCYVLDGSGVQGLDLQSGTELWSAPQAAGMNSVLATLTVSGDAVVVVESTMLALDTETGRQLWVNNDLFMFGKAAAQNGLLFIEGIGWDSTGGDALWAMDAGTGRTLWLTTKLPVDGNSTSTDSLSVDGNLVAVEYTGDSDTSAPSGFSVFRSSTGQQLWTHSDQQRDDQWTVLVVGGNIYAATSASLYAFPGQAQVTTI